MSHWAPKTLRPKDPNGIFDIDDTIEVVKKSTNPMQEQRRKDGSPYTRPGTTALKPEGPSLYLNDEKLNKGSLTAEKDSSPSPDPDEVVKAYLKFNAE